MNSSRYPKYTDDNWEIPSFEEVQYIEKFNKYALVIPVINEGERIQEQLRRILDAKLPVDVIVADGGSSDGSLDSNYMREMKVTAVLVKTGPGKLGAQLRVAYAWCIRHGYKGIITIDGNGKDGVEAVTSMVGLLQEGFDYVQGSRYLAGGKAENTPLERTIANRCIHAPLLSFSGRHWYSDTTNGFRAYSVRYLVDPRVKPFREVFQGYELLFYLTVRAGQVGAKIAEVPVRRSYPRKQKTPTKITGVRGKFSVFTQTVLVALGAFHPSKESR